MRTTHNAKPCQDHLGRPFPSQAAMCRAWSVPQGVFRRRLKSGMALDQALTEPVDHQAIPCTGPDGIQYGSVAEMCRANGMSGATVRNRIRHHGTDISGQPDRNMFEALDHLGQAFPSVRAMCRHHGIKPYTYYERLKSGYTQEQALTAAPYMIRHKKVTDFDGTPFPTMTHMCRHWHVTPSAGLSRVNRLGEAPQDAVRSLAISTWPGSRAGAHEVLRCVEWPWFLCADENGGTVLLHASQVRDMKQADAKDEKDDTRKE